MLSLSLGSLVAMSLFLALLYAEENWRGRRTWNTYQRRLAAKGVDFNWHSLAPPPVPDAENFAATHTTTTDGRGNQGWKKRSSGFPTVEGCRPNDHAEEGIYSEFRF